MDPRSIIFFDGECNLCNGAVRVILDRDANARFYFSPLQSEFARSFLPPFGIDPDEKSSIVLYDAGDIHTHADAIAEVSKHLSGVWKAGQWLRRLPDDWSLRVYSFVARNRYRIFGKRDSCRMPTPEESSRFLIQK